MIQSEVLTFAPSLTGPSAAPSANVLDAQALANLAQLDPRGTNHLLPRVLSTYRSSLARLLGQLGPAREPLQPETVRLVTHTLKSSSASVGALALSALCGAAEQALREVRLDELPALLDALLAEAARVDVAIQQLLVTT